MKIAFASDHAAASQRDALIDQIKKLGHEVIDCGAAGEESVDYPRYALRAIIKMQKGEADEAVLVCGTGIGMSIAANRFPNIFCARCVDEFDAESARKHNNANCLALRSRRMPLENNLQVLKTWFSNDFTGEERHRRRNSEIDEIASQIQKGELP